jgi:hypothetical protein
MTNLFSLTSAQLSRAAEIKNQIETLNLDLATVLGFSGEISAPVRAKRGRPKKIVAASAVPEGDPAGAKPKKRRKMSAAGRARIAAAQKARWARVQAGKRD